MNVLDLFSGIGGFSLGLERAGMRTVAFCEIEPFPRAVLAKHWPGVPCYEDVRDVTAERLARDGVPPPELICGGYPCQPFSHAGKQRGSEDPRHLWPEMRRVIGEVRPAWVVAENVVGHVALGLDQVLADLETDGYAGRAIVIPAAAVDAPHIRQRVWIMARDRDRDRESVGAFDAKVERVSGDLADAECEGLEGYAGDEGAAEGRSGSQRGPVASRRVPRGIGPLLPDDGLRRSEGARASERRRPQPARWLPEPGVGRVANGIPRRMDRLRALGNAVVPQIPEMIGRAILEAEA